MRGRRLAVVHFTDAVHAVAIAAARRGSQPGKQQPARVYADEVAVDQFGRVIVATATVLDLVDRGYRGLEVGDEVDRMGIAMAIDAGRLLIVNAAAYLAMRTPVAVAAALLVGQRLEIFAFMLCSDVGMTVVTLGIGMGWRRRINVLMALGADDFFRRDGCRPQYWNEDYGDRGHDRSVLRKC